MTLYALLASAAAIALSFIGTYLVRTYSIKKKILDVPNWRSAHQVPTPRGGGAAIVFAFAVTGLAFVSEPLAAPFLAILAPAVAMAVLGWADDCFSLPANPRFLVQLLLALICVHFVLTAGTLDFLGLSAAPRAFQLLIATFFITWMANLYNFMDGIDGITSLQTVTVCLGALAHGLHDVGLATSYALLAGATFGFLLWNWSPAKIFMGDVGSAPIGFLLAGFALWGADQLTLPAALILNGTFIVDATYTLFRRLFAGEKITQAHNDHAYQHATHKGHSHARVSLVYGAINLFWLLPMSFGAVVWSSYWSLWLVGAWLPLLCLCVAWKAGVRSSPSESPTPAPAPLN